MFAQLKLLAGVVLVAAVAAAGWHYRSALAERDVAAQRAEAAERVAAGERAARVKEQEIARSDNAAAAAYQKELENGKIEQQGAVARLRAALRLRDQRAAGAGNLPEASAGSGGRDGETGADFLAAHGEDALRLAAEADDAVRQLSACQVILSSDRAQ
ncbi:hypothetical protein [Chromobacterium haemolyticum]|uniref:hypothetical protein n=1 Tax=Chromobacterium haemolyticum TaxID=394935 RepID=UPI00307E9463